MRYRAGWIMKNRILALTHFEPEVTPEDFRAIEADANRALGQATEPFHLLIDNRMIARTAIITLDAILKAMPSIHHPQLRTIVIVLPEAIKEQAPGIDEQRIGLIRLKYVDGLESALAYLQGEDDSIDGRAISYSFFSRTGMQE